MRKYYQGCGGIANPDSLGYFEDGSYCAERKHDGIWASCIVKNGRAEFWSRNDKKKVEGDILHLVQFDLSSVDDSILTGELMAFSQASKKQKHITYNIYDIIKFKGQDVSNLNMVERRKIIESLSIYNGKYTLTKRYYSGFKELFDKIVAEGGEGIVIKKMKGKTPYRGNTRNINWYKVKKEVRISYVIAGFNDSDCDSWPGDIKSIQGALYDDEGNLRTVCNIGSMTGAERRWFSDHRDEAIGKVIECKGYEIFKSGALRHPSLIGFRDDVDPKECTFEQINRK